MNEIVGRDTELEAIDRWLDAPAPATLVLDGEAGMGKTTLWRAAVERAGAKGRRVLTSSAVAAEAQISFTAVRDLLADCFAEIEDELSPPQRRALAVTLLREDPSDTPPEQSAIAVAFRSALLAVAERTPLVLAVDDVQWVDPASATPLGYTLRRLDGVPVHALLARRSHEPVPSELAPSLRETEVRALHLEPLTIGALGRVLHDRLDATFPRPTLRRLYDTCGGNPFYALELARALAAAPLSPGDPLPIPGSLHELVDERLGSLGETTLDTLWYAAALSRPTIDLLDAALDGDARTALGPATEAQVARLERDAVEFAHPLFEAATYELLAPRRHAMHARLAQIVVDEEERARHLALGTAAADERVARLVEDGATLAFARGSPSVATTLVSEARRLTPVYEEEAAKRRAIAEVDYAFAAGDTARASSLLDDLLVRADPGLERARLLSRLARLRHFGADISSSVELLYEALDDAGEDAALRGEIEEGLAWGLLLVRRDLGDGLAHARSAATLAEARGAPSALAEALAAQAITEFVIGEEWEETMQRALALEEATLELRVLRHPTFAYGYCLSCADEIDRARACFEELLRRADEKGDEGSVPSIRNHLTLLEFLSGDWGLAIEHAADGFERALESGQVPTQASILAKRGLVEARRGRLDEAADTALRALAIAGAGADMPSEEAPARGGETAIWVLGLVELGRDDPERAHRYFAPMCRVLLDAGVREPGELRCLPDEIEALVALGHTDEAEAHVRLLEEWAARLGRRSSEASARRCRGLLLAGGGDIGGAISSLRDATALSEGLSMPYEHARALVALGTEQRRARHRKDARDTLQAALAIFEQLGADLWAERARAEIGRIGGRAPSPGGLTATERRVAGLVSEGKSNKEVAAALVVSVHTVEAALTSIYRKLDVRSRTELAHKLAGSD